MRQRRREDEQQQRHPLQNHPQTHQAIAVFLIKFPAPRHAINAQPQRDDNRAQGNKHTDSNRPCHPAIVGR